MYKVDGNSSTATIKVIGFDHHSTAPAAAAGGNDDRQKPSASPDGNQVIFTSDWGVPNGSLSSYIIRGIQTELPCNNDEPIGCPTAVVANGNISIAEPLPAGGSSWLSSSPFWSCTQNGNTFDVTPYKSAPNPNAFTLVGLPNANYCCNFEGIPLNANGNQLATVYNQCCFTVGTPSNDAGCPDSPVEVNTNFTITANTNASYQNCTWMQNGQALNGVTGNTLTTQVGTSGTYNFTATCCSSDNGNGNSILPLKTQITAADDPGPPGIGIPPKCAWVDHPHQAGVEIMRINDGASQNVFGDVHQYSRRSAFTVDGKYFVTNDGRFINVDDCSVKCDIGTSSEFVLSQLDPDVAFGWSGSNFYKVNCNNVNNKQLLFSAPTGLNKYTIGRWEGQQDFNDKYILLEYSASNAGGTAVILNLQTGATGSTLNLSNVPGTFNWADVSASGTYALVGTSIGVYRFNTPNFTNQTQMNITNRTGNYHYDMFYDALGNEIMGMTGVGSSSSPTQDWAYNILATNQYVTLDALIGPEITAQSHVSGQAKNRPGWMYVSGTNKTYPNNYLFSIEMKPGNNQVESWGSTYSSVNPSYIAEPKASVNPNGDMVVISTNWNVNGGPVYEVIYRPKNFVAQQQCETFSCSVTAVGTDNPDKINGCPNADLKAPASWNVQSNLSNGETFVIWTWTLNGQAVNLPDVTDPGFGVKDAAAGYYIGTMNYLDINGNAKTQTCAINVTSKDCNPNCDDATIYEAEAATLYGVTKSNSNYTNISNGEYVTGFDEDDDQIIFNTVNVPEAGTYTLTIRYACSSYKENYLSVNGGDNQNISFPASSTLTDKSIQINLNEGNNTITIAKHWGWFDVDYIKIEEPGNEEQPQPGATNRFEAENGLPSGVSIENNASASAGKYVTNFRDDNDKITVNAQLENAGMYQLKIGYRSTSGEKKNDVYLNDLFLGNIQFLQSNAFTEMVVGDFYFDAGQNTIEFIKSWGWMDVDYFEVVASNNQTGNSFNDICNRTVDIGTAPTADYFRAGTINADATIAANRSVQFIGTNVVNLTDGFTVEQGGEFITGIEDCEEQLTCGDNRYVTHEVLSTSSQSIQLKMETAENMPLRLSFYPTANPTTVQIQPCEYSYNYGANGNEHRQTISGLNAATGYTFVIQSSTDLVNDSSECPNMNWEDISCPFQVITNNN